MFLVFVVATRQVAVVTNLVKLTLQGVKAFGGLLAPRCLILVYGILGPHVLGREVGHNDIGSRQYAHLAAVGMECRKGSG